VFIEGSVLDRSKLTGIFRGCDCIVHIAAWHGIHEDRGEKGAYDFFDLKMRRLLYEAATVLMTRTRKWSRLRAWGIAVAKRRG
jgi:hypothetical protein